MNPSDAWMQTYTGVQFCPLKCEASDVVPEDIAHALSMVCRFNGHVKEFYSVAQHSLHVMELVPDDEKLIALLHDAPEAYLFDAVSPVKSSLGASYRAVERLIWQAVCERFSLPFGVGSDGRIVLPDSVREADLNMLATEKVYLMADYGHDWGEPIDSAPMVMPCIRPFKPDEAKFLFLTELHDLWPEYIKRLKDAR